MLLREEGRKKKRAWRQGGRRQGGRREGGRRKKKGKEFSLPIFYRAPIKCSAKIRCGILFCNPARV
jgi:hypothetical protein